MRAFIYIVLSILGAITAGYMIFFAVHLYPTVIFRLLGRGIMVVIFIIVAVYVGSIALMKGIAFPKYPITKKAKISAVCGLLSIVTLVLGFSFLFSILGIIFGVLGMITHDKKSRQAAIYGFVSSFVTLIVITAVAIIGYMQITGQIQW